VLLRRRRGLVQYTLIYAAVLAAYAPWLPVLWAHLHHEAVYIARPGISAAGSYLLFLFNWSWCVAVPAAALYALLLVDDVRALVEKGRNRQPVGAALRADLWVVLWLVVPFGLVFVKSLVSVPVLANKVLIISMPAAYLLLARAVVRLPVRAIGHTIIPVVISAALLLHLVLVKDYYSAPHKEQFREAAAFLVERDSPDEKTLVLAAAWSERYFDYYLGRLGSARRVDAKAWREADVPLVTRLLKARAPGSIWYLRGHVEPEPAFLGFLERELRLVEHKAFLGADAWLFETRQPPSDNETDQGTSETHE